MPNTASRPAYLAIHGLRDLVPLGINPLTGEACAYSQRVLCDVSEAGRELLQDFFGVQTFATHPNMNSLVGEAPAIGSVMLARNLWRDLAAYYAFSSGALAYVTAPDGAMMLLYEEALADRYAAHPEFELTRNPTIGATAPRVGSRNVHIATGRVM